MNQLTKRIVIINLIASIFLAIVIGSAIFAWYIDRNQTASVDVTTNGLVLTYEIDEDEDTIDTPTYSISNLVFFDVDSAYEGKYFTTMAHIIRIDITNKSKKMVDITLSYVDSSSLTDPYVACIVSDVNTLDSTSSNSSVLNYISTNSLDTTHTISNKQTNATATFYVYIYGVQPDDAATNDFLYYDQAQTQGETYQFELKIEATVTPGQDPTIEESGNASSNN